MAAETNLTRVSIPAADIDFVEQFGKSVRGIADILGVSRLQGLPVGSLVKIYSSTVTLAGGAVDPGDIIPLSLVERAVASSQELVYDKRRKAVPVEDIQKVGYENAVTKTDDALLKELRKRFLTNFYTFLATGTGTASGATLQAVMAQVGGKVDVAFEGEGVEKIGWIHPMDLADYQATHVVTLESANGLSYLKNFLGYDVVIVTASVPEGKVYGTAAENVSIVYADVSGAIDDAFPAFYKDSTLPMIGVAHSPTYERLQAETVTLSGVLLYPERLDGIIVGTITAI